MTKPAPARNMPWKSSQVPQVMSVLVQPETRTLIAKLQAGSGEPETALMNRMIQVGVQTELIRLRWLRGLMTLSRRKREVAFRLLEGKDYVTIAKEMGIRPLTAQEYGGYATAALGMNQRFGVVSRFGFLVLVYPKDQLVIVDDFSKQEP